MICHYHIVAGESSEKVEADPTIPADRVRVLEAAQRVQDAAPGARLLVSSRLIGPEHISSPLNRIMAEIEDERRAQVGDA